jgi:hypothetical protein
VAEVVSARPATIGPGKAEQTKRPGGWADSDGMTSRGKPCAGRALYIGAVSRSLEAIPNPPLTRPGKPGETEGCPGGRTGRTAGQTLHSPPEAGQIDTLIRKRSQVRCPFGGARTPPSEAVGFLVQSPSDTSRSCSDMAICHVIGLGQAWALLVSTAHSHGGSVRLRSRKGNTTRGPPCGPERPLNSGSSLLGSPETVRINGCLLRRHTLS